ncbi:MAG: flagellar motor protein MotB [Butyricicoccus sp.]|nr:flagellar motor protein MotB [Butyricicoccus sp.]
MKRRRKGGGGANWQDTYGDMVTLLLCFFVLLYSMSTINETKWAMVVQSFQRETTSETMGTPGQGTGLEDEEKDTESITEEDVNQALDQIAMALKDYSNKNNLNEQMSVTSGADYVFITFQDAVFFEGDSYTLLDSGKAMLDQVAQAIAPQSNLIDELRVMGHTSQGSPTQANNPTVDRFLASNRAAVVTVYLQEKNIIDPDKLVSVGYGQWRPIAGFDTEQERAQNRRVEIMITGLDPESAENGVEKYFSVREGDE